MQILHIISNLCFKMKDDPEFNMKFIALIQTQPCLYDYTCAGYSRKFVQDKAWETISKKVSESVQDCKERWKNLRGCYTRHLKSLASPTFGRRKKKPYYLAEHLTFIKPFTKSRFSQNATTNNAETVSAVWSPKHSIDSNSNNDTESEHFFNPVEEHAQDPFISPLPNKIRITSSCSTASDENMNNRAPFEFYPTQKNEIIDKNDDPDLAFFISILPDVKEMNSSQKRQLKRGVLNLLEEILTENTANSNA